MSTDKQYLRQLSQTCKRSDAYTRLWNIDAHLERDGADDRLRMALLEGIVQYVISGTVPEAEKWKTIDAYVDLEEVSGLDLVTRIAAVVALPTGDYRSKPTDSRVPAQEERIEDLLREGQYEEPEEDSLEVVDDQNQEE